MEKINTVKLLTRLGALSIDMHQKSTRPCKTCLELSKELGFYFGCYSLMEELGHKLPEIENKAF